MFSETVYGNHIFPNKCHVVTLTYMIIYEKCIIFVIAYGEMHDLLAWKRQASLIEFLEMDFINLLHYLQNLKMLYLDL